MTRASHVRPFTIASCMVLGSCVVTHGATFFAPSPYTSTADSPIAPLVSIFANETFEDGLINTPGIIASTGTVTSPAIFTDSVDGDDGLIDGSGAAGRSLISVPATTFIDFSLDAGAGLFPTHAGLVVTDVGQVFTGTIGFARVVFEAFGPLGESLGTTDFDFGDGAATGATAEDRFVGVFNAAGVSRIRISIPDSNDWEVDHVQWGIPSPASAALAALGACLIARRRR